MLHKVNRDFGTSSVHLYKTIKKCIEIYRPQSIIDYGCGKGLLKAVIEKDFNLTCYNYDPYVSAHSSMPPLNTYDLLINTDVLEHVPEADVDTILGQMANISKIAFFNISCRKAGTILPNGENAHCTIYPPRWWQHKLAQHFGNVCEIDTDDLTACTFIATNSSKTLRIIKNHSSKNKVLRACIKMLPYFIAKKILGR